MLHADTIVDREIDRDDRLKRRDKNAAADLRPADSAGN